MPDSARAKQQLRIRARGASPFPPHGRCLARCLTHRSRLWKAAWSLHPAGDPAAEDWVAVKALAVLAGDSARVAAEITAEADAAGLTAGQRNGADTCVRYLTSKHEFLRYNQALAAGWPIATGVIEGACRHLIGDRLDITGARWDWTAPNSSSPCAR
jgi:hypothetical protein